MNEDKKTSNTNKQNKWWQKVHICKCSVILDTHQALVKTISGVLNTMKIHVLNNMKNKHYDHNVIYHVLI